jgi:hypothetical protein
VLAQGALLIGFAAAVMHEARKFRMPPRHVWAISASYIALTIGYMIEVGSRVGHALSWRTIVALVAFSFGNWSMLLMYRAYKYAARLRRHERKAVEEGNRIMQQVFERSSSHPGERQD